MKKQRFVMDLPDGSELYGYNYMDYPLHKFRGIESFDSFYPITLHSFGDDYWHRECFRQRINSNVFAVEYVKEGIFIFNHNGIEVKCGPGEIFLVHLGSDSSMRCETLNAVKRQTTISGPMLETLLSTLGLDRVFCIRPTDNRPIDRIFDEIFKFLDESVPVDCLRISTLCYELLLALAEQSTAVSRPEELQKAISCIHQSLNRNLSLEELSRHTGVSRATLHRMFQTHLKCSPINYFIMRKMEKARSLLPYYPVKKVAAMLNFSSAQYFSSEFKKCYSVSPKAFRCRLTPEALSAAQNPKNPTPKGS